MMIVMKMALGMAMAMNFRFSLDGMNQRAVFSVCSMY